MKEVQKGREERRSGMGKRSGRRAKRGKGRRRKWRIVLRLLFSGRGQM